MAEIVHVFDTRLVLDGVPYTAQVAARPDRHIWEGWLEFIADDGSDVRRTPRETTQPDRHAIVYWATGLSPTYLEGALQRTLPPPPVRPQPLPEPAFDAPAPRLPSEGVVTDRAVLDPFSVGAKGETLLRRELSALAAWHLRNIVRAYGLADTATDLEQLDQRALIELIVAGVEPA